MYQSLMSVTCDHINSWSPSEEYPREPGYTKDLYQYLTSKMQNADVTRDDKNNKIGLDIGIRQKSIYGTQSVGIELKRNLKKTSHQNRLLGQLETKGRQYGNIIIVLVGESDNNMVVDTKKWIENKKNPFTGGSPKGYQLINKGNND